MMCLAMLSVLRMCLARMLVFNTSDQRLWWTKKLSWVTLHSCYSTSLSSGFHPTHLRESAAEYIVQSNLIQSSISVHEFLAKETIHYSSCYNIWGAYTEVIYLPMKYTMKSKTNVSQQIIHYITLTQQLQVFFYMDSYAIFFHSEQLLEKRER